MKDIQEICKQTDEEIREIKRPVSTEIARKFYDLQKRNLEDCSDLEKERYFPICANDFFDEYEVELDEYCERINETLCDGVTAMNFAASNKYPGIQKSRVERVVARGKAYVIDKVRSGVVKIGFHLYKKEMEDERRRQNASFRRKRFCGRCMTACAVAAIFLFEGWFFCGTLKNIDMLKYRELVGNRLLDKLDRFLPEIGVEGNDVFLALGACFLASSLFCCFLSWAIARGNKKPLPPNHRSVSFDAWLESKLATGILNPLAKLYADVEKESGSILNAALETLCSQILMQKR